MENEQVFTATANIDALSQTPQGLSYRGHDTVKAAAGGIDILDPHGHERSPLLGRTRYSHDPQTEEPIFAADRNDDSWIGDGEFAQKPWWNRPSVSEQSTGGGPPAEYVSIDLLVATSVSVIYLCLRRFYCPKN